MPQLKTRQHKTPRKIHPLDAVILFLAVLAGGLIVYLYPFAAKEQAAYFQGSFPIVFQGKQAGNAKIDGNVVYLPVSFIKEYIDEGIFYDEKSNSMIITTPDKVIQIPADSVTCYINEQPVSLNHPAFKNEGGEFFIALESILDYYLVEYFSFSETEGIWILRDGDTFVNGTVTEKKVREDWLRLRMEPGLRSPYTAGLSPGEHVFIEGEKENYYYVRKASNGIAGYVRKKYINQGATSKVTAKLEQNPAKLPKPDGPVQLTWEAVYSRNPNPEKIPLMPGVNVVSPTWFKLSDTNGSISNTGSLEYVKWAKEQGYQVWGLFSNSFDPDLTRSAFQNFETRQNMIRKLLEYSQMYDLDGINIDIENVYPEDGPLITQFVREAAPYFHNAGLIVSMDITFIAEGNWSAFYERDKLAKIVDYLIVMAYDEHWSTSPVAGSVASLPWVEMNLQKLLEVVPNEKLVLGVPLYTRLWTVSDTGEVSSKSMSMEDVEQWLTENNIQPVYDQDTGQNYAELYVPEERVTYKIWLEDELSLSKRKQLAEKYKLAGIGSWSRHFANEKAWTALNLLN